MKTRLKMVVPAPLDIESADKQYLESSGFILYDDLPTDNQDLLHRIVDAELLVAAKINVDQALIDSLPKLQYIIVPSVGFEWVDTAYARSKNILVMNCPTHNSIAVAEHAVMLALATKRKLLAVNQGMKSGVWYSEDYAGNEIYSKQIAIIGNGRTGKHIGRIIEGFGAEISYITSNSNPEDLKRAANTSDIIFICVASNDSTKEMISRSFFQQMKKDTVLVNTSRGTVIDQAALIETLGQGMISAGLDVFQGEPDHHETIPLEIMDIANLHNVTATPHVAYKTRESGERLVTEVVDVVNSCLEGTPINVVN